MTSVTSKSGSRRVVAAVVIVLLVLAAGGIVYLLLPVGKKQADTPKRPPPSSSAPGPLPANLALVAPARTEQAADQVASAIGAAYSYDSAKLEQHKSSVDGVVIGKARADLERSLTGLQGKPATSVTTKVTESAVTSLTGNTATVLVALTEKVRSEGKTHDLLARMLVTARHQGALWQITDTDAKFDKPIPRPNVGDLRPENRADLPPMQLAAQRDLVLSAAMTDAERFASSDYRDPDRSLSATIAMTTGKLHDQAVAGKAANADKIAKRETVIEAHTVVAGVRRLDLRAGTADVLVAMNSDVTAPNGDKGTTPSTVALRMQRIGDQWLVSNVQNL